MLAEGSTEWNTSISTSPFNWKASLNQLRDNGLYRDLDLVGSNSIIVCLILEVVTVKTPCSLNPKSFI
ncbi:hypothetical protein LCGC14_1357000 [marine sediment metagenome]|uniref:Uncharacterized protein n=1 Tax=marine sediment metagenome TaxID=412755 RepID=A0A0F9K9U5_9ZZZZ